MERAPFFEIFRASTFWHFLDVVSYFLGLQASIFGILYTKVKDSYQQTANRYQEARPSCAECPPRSGIKDNSVIWVCQDLDPGSRKKPIIRGFQGLDLGSRTSSLSRFVKPSSQQEHTRSRHFLWVCVVGAKDAEASWLDVLLNRP